MLFCSARNVLVYFTFFVPSDAVKLMSCQNTEEKKKKRRRFITKSNASFCCDDFYKSTQNESRVKGVVLC